MDKAPSGGSGYAGQGDTASLVTEQVKQGTQQVMQQTQETAGQVAEGARKQAVGYADSQKQQATQSLQTVAQALRQTGESLQTQNQSSIAQYAQGAADRVESFSGYLERTPVQQLMRDAEDYARRHSSLFLGGAALIGFAAARFLKASSQSSGSSSGGSGGRYGYGGGYSGYSAYGGGGLSGQGTYASGAPYGDVSLGGTPSMSGEISAGMTGERHYANASLLESEGATQFDPESGTETTDGPAI